MTGAREDLAAWMRANVPAEKHREFSRVVAAYVADCVRADRVKRADEAALAGRVRESVDRVNALGRDPAERRAIDHLMGSMFGGRR